MKPACQFVGPAPGAGLRAVVGVKVRVFRCDWQGCAVSLPTPFADGTAAERFAWEQGWLWTSGGAEQQFCGARESGQRVGYSQQMTEEHVPALHRLTHCRRGCFVGCVCGWAATGYLELSVRTAAEVRAGWSQHAAMVTPPGELVLSAGPPRQGGRGGRAGGGVGVGGGELVEAGVPADVEVLVVVVPARGDRCWPAQGGRCWWAAGGAAGLGEIREGADVEGRVVPGVAGGLLVVGAGHGPGRVGCGVDPWGAALCGLW